ncbi:hypothetical protein ACW9KT_10840 [Hymenobacter sp. HD11105]
MNGLQIDLVKDNTHLSAALVGLILIMFHGLVKGVTSEIGKQLGTLIWNFIINTNSKIINSFKEMNENTEVLLTQEEIKSILTAATDPRLSIPNLFLFSSSPRAHTDIYKISPIKGLIFIKGNHHTGYEHIYARHGYWSNQVYWKNLDNQSEENTIRRGNPSKFSPKTVPIIDFCDIADSIYSPENLDLKTNTRPNEFEKYNGEHINGHGESAIYNMLVYRNTLIVHTLFPQSSRNNKKIDDKFLFVRGHAWSETHLQSDITEVIIPYKNIKKLIQYSIVIRLNPVSKVVDTLICIHDEHEQRTESMLVGSRPYTENDNDITDDHLRWLNQADLRHLEQFIKNTERGVYKRA